LEIAFASSSWETDRARATDPDADFVPAGDERRLGSRISPAAALPE